MTTSPDEWARVRAILELALDADEAQRAALIEAECARAELPVASVLQLLAAEGEGDGLEPPAAVNLIELLRPRFPDGAADD